MKPRVADVHRSVNDVFVDAAISERFRRDGYVVVDSIASATVESLHDLFVQTTPTNLAGMYSNVHVLPYEQNLEIGSAIDSVVTPLVERYCNDYISRGGTFLVKAPGEASVCHLHQDWNTVDEARWVALVVWIPLVDVDARNGCLTVLPGSHRPGLFPTIRSADIPNAHLAVDDRLREMTVDLPMQAGDVCFFAQDLFHASHPNMGASPRPALYAGAIPAKAQMIHYHRSVDGSIEEIGIGVDFYYDNTAGDLMDGKGIQDANVIRSLPEACAVEVTRDEIIAVMASQPGNGEP